MTVWLVNCFDHRDRLVWTYAFSREALARDFEAEHEDEYDYTDLRETEIEND